MTEEPEPQRLVRVLAFALRHNPLRFGVGLDDDAVNSALVLVYWSIGDRIRRDILKEKRADYGNRILGTLSQELSDHYGMGYTYDNLTRMLKLAEMYPDIEIVGALSRQLGWSHFLLLLPILEMLKRDFYAECAASNGGASCRSPAGRGSPSTAGYPW